MKTPRNAQKTVPCSKRRYLYYYVKQFFVDTDHWSTKFLLHLYQTLGITQFLALISDLKLVFSSVLYFSAIKVFENLRISSSSHRRRSLL